MKQILDADFGARVAGCLPFWDGGWLRQFVHAFVEQDSEQSGGDALAHRPAFEWSVPVHPLAVALGDEAALPGDHESSGQGLGRLECSVDSRLEFYRVDLRGQRPLRQHISHRPWLGASIR